MHSIPLDTPTVGNMFTRTFRDGFFGNRRLRVELNDGRIYNLN